MDGRVPGSVMASATSLTGLVLAGGRSSRMGEDKAQLSLGGESLVQRSIRAFDASTPVVIVGERAAATDREVTWVREDPPFAGPVAALACGVEQVQTEWVVVIPCDLAHPDDAVQALLNAIAPDFARDVDAVLARDSDNRAQWLTGAFRTERLREVLSVLPTLDCPVRVAFEGLSLDFVDGPDAQPDIWQDMDTPDDVNRVREGAR